MRTLRLFLTTFFLAGSFPYSLNSFCSSSVMDCIIPKAHRYQHQRARMRDDENRRPTGEMVGQKGNVRSCRPCSSGAD